MTTGDQETPPIQPPPLPDGGATSFAVTAARYSRRKGIGGSVRYMGTFSNTSVAGCCGEEGMSSVSGSLSSVVRDMNNLTLQLKTEGLRSANPPEKGYLHELARKRLQLERSRSAGYLHDLARKKIQLEKTRGVKTTIDSESLKDHLSQHVSTDQSTTKVKDKSSNGGREMGDRPHEQQGDAARKNAQERDGKPTVQRTSTRGPQESSQSVSDRAPNVRVRAMSMPRLGWIQTAGAPTAAAAAVSQHIASYDTASGNGAAAAKSLARSSSSSSSSSSSAGISRAISKRALVAPTDGDHEDDVLAEANKVLSEFKLGKINIKNELIVFEGSDKWLADIKKVDFHQHCTHLDIDGLKMLLAANRSCGIQRCVLLALRSSKSSRQDVHSRNNWVLSMAERFPQIVPFVTIIEDDPHAAEILQDCIQRGAKGLKLIGWHSNYIKEHNYDLRRPSLVDAFKVAALHRIPVLLHVWLGYTHTDRDYVSDIDSILTDIPDLRLVLAHFGLGFDPQTLPALSTLLARHQQLYVDTSLYGTFCELWFTRASNRARALSSLVCRFPRQCLFGSDVFGRSNKHATYFGNALRASVKFITESTLACPEFKRTSYFDGATEDDYGPVAFNPSSLVALGLGERTDLIQRVFSQNAEELLELKPMNKIA